MTPSVGGGRGLEGEEGLGCAQLPYLGNYYVCLL
jgi:hypothetical protein